MWCRHCLREVSPGHGGSATVTCPFCGRGLEAVTAQSQAVRQAREILERWQASDLFDRITSSDVVPEHKSQPRAVPAALPQPEKLQPATVITPAHKATTAVLPAPAALPRLPQPATTPERAAKSVIRELPPLPLDVLAPAPVMAAAIAAAPRRQKSAVHPESDNSSDTADWEPPPRHTEARDSAESRSPAHFSEDPPQVSAPPTTPVTDSEAAIAAFFEASSADLFSTAQEQASTPAVPVAIATATTPRIATETITETITETRTTLATVQTPEQTPAGPHPTQNHTPDHKAVPQIAAAAGLPVSGEATVDQPAGSNPIVSKEPVSAAADDAPVILHASPAKSRPALRRPPLTRRTSAPMEPVQPIPGTIPMNRNTTTEASGQQPVVPSPVTPPAIAPAPPVMISNSPESGVRERRDAAEPSGGERPHLTGWIRPPQRYIDERHDPPVRGPHFEVSPPPRSNFTTVIGQGLAYIGVIALLIGTSLVILGHFGGESDYTPTGWLITTVAQMLLFLGIINLVSGGMEQHNDEVARRIHSLSEHLIRIEQATSEAVMAARQAGESQVQRESRKQAVTEV
ncbi:MAG: hypothetical protein ACKO2P_21680 [Planctomycetota bacterium]